MRYAYKDLGRQSAGTTAVVRWRGSGAAVLLLDPVNFTKYCEGTKPVRYNGGGHYSSSPARIAVPRDGRWYVVADLGGHSFDAKATVELVTPANQEPAEEESLTPVG
jgi:hypothetical protein